MSGALLFLAPFFALGAAVAATGIVMARSVFAMAMYLAAMCAFGAAALLAMAQADAALALAAFGAGLAPASVLAVSALTVRAARPRRRIAWLTVGAALLAAGASGAWIAVSAPNLAHATASDAVDVSPWYAPVLLAAALGALGLLGYGERGLFERSAGLERDE